MELKTEIQEGKSMDSKKRINETEEKEKRIEKMFDNLVKHIQEASHPGLEKKR